jgi:DNA mismatch repair protein MutS2
VRIRTLDQKGIVTTIGKEEAEVQVGVLRVRARLSDLELQGGEPIVKVGKDTDIISAGGFTHESPGTELSLRGLRVDEALESLDRHLDSAYLARLPYVRIIHGKGTGRLRQAVRQTLQDHPHVKKFERGKEHEGGDGVTIVSLKQE